MINSGKVNHSGFFLKTMLNKAFCTAIGNTAKAGFNLRVI